MLITRKIPIPRQDTPEETAVLAAVWGCQNNSSQDIKVNVTRLNQAEFRRLCAEHGLECLSVDAHSTTHSIDGEPQQQVYIQVKPTTKRCN